MKTSALSAPAIDSHALAAAAEWCAGYYPRISDPSGAIASTYRAIRSLLLDPYRGKTLDPFRFRLPVEIIADRVELLTGSPVDVADVWATIDGLTETGSLQIIVEGYAFAKRRCDRAHVLALPATGSIL